MSLRKGEFYNRWGGTLGGSVALELAAGYDLIFMDGYMGTGVTVGVGVNSPMTGFIETHGEVSYTDTLIAFNLYEFLEAFKFKEIESCSD